ncbi:hypothetical protein CVM73_07205 [Bradyrhizobium forestalis]|uniref:Uncharacterized protein n=1 Tax=Bradyrhizobium forestalis TaxID=1419263 RepID=A0A2M8RDN9_9BRAD|nr:hypothetical protein CVM73_07205 [Bradyrhizobium forestalis]
MRQLIDACGRIHDAFNNVIFVVLKLALNVALKRCVRLVDSASIGPCFRPPIAATAHHPPRGLTRHGAVTES